MLVPGVTTKVPVGAWVSQCGIRVKRTGFAKERLHPVFPGLSGSLRFGIHNNNLDNGCRALVERVFLREHNGALVPPPPCVADVGVTLGEFKAKLNALLGVHRRWSVAQFIGCYHGRRQQVYERAAASLETTPVHRGDFKVMNAFVKAEKINFTSKPDPAPRVIQPRNPRYNVEVGRYLKGLEHHVYEAIGSIMGGPTVMKGYNAEEVAQHIAAAWESIPDPVAVGLDASRFDQHVRPAMLEWEHSVYLDCFRGQERDHLAWLLRGQVHNECVMRVSDGVAHYRVHGSRMSGDMNTALGNCLVMCAMVWHLLRKLGIRGRLFNNGDDCVVIMSRTHLAAFQRECVRHFLDYGFTMKVEDPAFMMEQIEFCQARPVFDGQRWLMVRVPHTCVSKDATCVVKDYGWGEAARSWLGAVGECGMAMTGGIPVMSEYYSTFACAGKPGARLAVVTETGMAMLSKGLHRNGYHITDAARVSFWRAFGLSPTHQRELEDRFRRISIVVPEHPCICRIPPAGAIPYYG